MAIRVKNRENEKYYRLRSRYTEALFIFIYEGFKSIKLIQNGLAGAFTVVRGCLKITAGK